MPANVDSMFSVRTMPWHREGLILDEAPTSWAEARKFAGLEWEPVEEDVYRVNFETQDVPQYEFYGLGTNGEVLYTQSGLALATQVPVVERSPGHKHIVRSDNRNVLSVNAKGYTIINHQEMGEIIESVIGLDNVKWETAGSLNGGRTVWALALLDEPIILPGDNTVTMPYMAFTNSHDGTGSCALRATAVRIVCANTVKMSEAEGERTGATFSFRHSAQWRDRIEDARQAVHGVRAEMAAYQVWATELLATPFSLEQRETFTQTLFPMPNLASDRVKNNVETDRINFRAIFESPTTQEIAHTAYGAVQAAVEYLDHIKTARSWETKLNRSLLKPEPLKAKAVKLVRELVASGV